MSPKQLTRWALYVGSASIIGGIVMMVGRPEIGVYAWWPVLGILLSVGLFTFALIRGWLLTVKERVAMSDAINLCYLGEEQKEDNQSYITG